LAKILLANWDNFPNISTGGVYTWAKTLVGGLPKWEFIVLNQLSNANTNSRYELPKNVSKVIEVPIYGTNRIEEFYGDGLAHYLKILSTTDSVVEGKFLPLFTEFLSNVLSEKADPKMITMQIYKMHTFFARYDWKKCFEHYLVLESFLDYLRSDKMYCTLKINEALAPFKMMQRGFQILALDFPKVDIVHCSTAWLPSLTALCAKLGHGSSVVITEHGIAFKELDLYINSALKSIPSRMLWKIFSRNIVRALYSVADRIISVSASNRIWQLKLGADPNKIKVVHNGVDTRRFRPMDVSVERKRILGEDKCKRPIVSSVGRVDFFKDIVCLIGAVGYAKNEIPDILCLQYGVGTDLEYSTQCLNAVREYGLEDNFLFMGSTKNPEVAYNIGDIIAMSSITEGFPYSVIEAMACGKAIVAADVGGVREALEGCGILVKSRSPSQLGRGIITLLKDTGQRKKFEQASLSRAKLHFNLRDNIREYESEYESLLRSKKLGTRTEGHLFGEFQSPMSEASANAWSVA
jgi:glycosyltransferase involved in cell wall biosynthesis